MFKACLHYLLSSHLRKRLGQCGKQFALNQNWNSTILWLGHVVLASCPTLLLLQFPYLQEGGIIIAPTSEILLIFHSCILTRYTDLDGWANCTSWPKPHPGVERRLADNRWSHTGPLGQECTIRKKVCNHGLNPNFIGTPTIYALRFIQCIFTDSSLGSARCSFLLDLASLLSKGFQFGRPERPRGKKDVWHVC